MRVVDGTQKQGQDVGELEVIVLETIFTRKTSHTKVRHAKDKPRSSEGIGGTIFNKDVSSMKITVFDVTLLHVIEQLQHRFQPVDDERDVHLIGIGRHEFPKTATLDKF